MMRIIQSVLPAVLFLITGSITIAADENPPAPPKQTSVDKTTPQPVTPQTKKTSAPESEKKPDKLIEAAATAARIVSGMKTAEEKITRKETGDDTRKVQKQVIDDLQSLIDAASRMQQQQQKQQQRQQQKSAQKDSEQQKEQQQNQADSGQGGNTRRKDDKGRDSTEAVGESAKRDAAADRQRKLLGEVWGHLPESLRQRLLNDLGEKTLPGYDDLVRRYFEALAEPPKTGSKSSEKKIK